MDWNIEFPVFNLIISNLSFKQRIQRYRDIQYLIQFLNPLIVSKVVVMKSGENQIGWICLVVEFNWVGSATN